MGYLRVTEGLGLAMRRMVSLLLKYFTFISSLTATQVMFVAVPGPSRYQSEA